MQAIKKKKLPALLLALCLAMGTSVPISAENGPSSGEKSSAYVHLVNSAEKTGHVLYSNSGKVDTVSGAAYDKSTNTITLTNYNHPEMDLVTNEMGDDLKLKLVGENHIQSLTVWGFGWGGNLEITGNGSLTINENKKSTSPAICFWAEGTDGLLDVGPEATLTVYKSSDKDARSAAFIGTTSSTMPFTGNMQTTLTMTPGSGIEGETLETEDVIAEVSSGEDSRSWDFLVKSGDEEGKEGIYAIGGYATRYKNMDWSNGIPVAFIYRLIEVDGLSSGYDMLAVKSETVEGVESNEMPDGYTVYSPASSCRAKTGAVISATVLKKDGNTFYWIKNEDGSYSVHKTAMDDVITEDRVGNSLLTKIVVPVKGATGATADDIPQGYSTNLIKTGIYSYYCTNDVIRIAPSDNSNKPAASKPAASKPAASKPATQLKAPRVKLKVNPRNIKLTWNKVNDAKGYVVYRKTGKGERKRIATVKKAATTSYTDKAILSGKKYSYQIKAYNGNKFSPSSNTVTTIFLKAQKLTVKKVSNGIKVSYNKTAGAKGYVIYRKTGKGKWTKRITINKAKRGSYVDKKAKKGKSYQYMIKAKSDGYYSDYMASRKIKR